MKARSAFTLLEILVVVGLVSVLAGVLLPAVSRANARGRTTKCASSLRQLGAAALLYAGEHDMTLPATVHQRRLGLKSWTVTLQEYAGGTVVFRCPDDEDKTRPYTYVLNDFLTPNPAGAPELDCSRLNALERPSATFVFAEASAGYVNSDHFHFSDYHGQPVPPAAFAEQVAAQRHQGAANYFFADGHLETLGWTAARQRLQTTNSRFVDPTAPE